MSEALDAPAFWPPAWIPDAFVAPSTVVTLRIASAGYATRGTDTPADTVYAPRLLDDVMISQSALDALGLGGRVAVTVGEIRMADGDDAAVNMDRYGTADGRAASIRILPVLDSAATDFGQPWSAATLAWSGLVARVTRADGRIARLALSDLSERLAVPLQSSLYGGAGGTDGPAELAGAPKPVTLGRVYNAEPVALGSIDLGVGALPTFHVHWRSVEEISAVRIRGVAQTLVGGTPGVGQARAFASQGLFQLGSSPDGSVRADVRGDNVGGYVSSTAGVLRRLMTAHGAAVPETDLDATAWAFADGDLAGEIGWCRGAVPTSAAAAAEEILAASGAVLAGGRAGTLRLFDPLAVDAAQFTLEAAHILACEPVPLPALLRPLPVAVAVQWRRNWAPIADAAAAAPAADRQRLAAPFSGPERAISVTTTARQALQRDLGFPGLYWSQADAAARAAKWRSWVEHGPRAFRVVTDRYLGQIEAGHIGRVTYPAYGLATGLLGVVMGWEEQLGGRRVRITFVTLPEG